jgi:short-subunit dehydrogenase
MTHAQSHAGKFSIVTGASTGIGLELAKNCAKDGMDILVVANEMEIEQAAETLRGLGAGRVEALQADLSNEAGVDKLIAAVEGRTIEHLIANAGRGLGDSFLNQDWADAKYVMDTNVTGTIYLIHNLARRMVQAGTGRILITGSIAGFMPGSYQAVYNGTKAFLDSFSYALREEIKDSGVSVTCLMPGATETEFFERADMMDTKIGQEKKMDAAEVAKQGYDAMLVGDGQVITGWKNKMQGPWPMCCRPNSLPNSIPRKLLPARQSTNHGDHHASKTAADTARQHQTYGWAEQRWARQSHVGGGGRSLRRCAGRLLFR